MEVEQPQAISYVSHHLEVIGQNAILASRVIGIKFVNPFKFKISTFILSCLYDQ